MTDPLGNVINKAPRAVEGLRSIHDGLIDSIKMCVYTNNEPLLVFTEKMIDEILALIERLNKLADNPSIGGTLVESITDGKYKDIHDVPHEEYPTISKAFASRYKPETQDNG